MTKRGGLVANLVTWIDGVPCIGLNKVRMPGKLVAVDVAERGREWTVLGERPEGSRG